MIGPPFRSPERDAAVERLLDAIAGGTSSGDRVVDGTGDAWSLAALRRAAGPDADLLFPEGPPELVEYATDLLDRRMVERARASDGAGRQARTGARVRAAILDRLGMLAPMPDAVRRGLALLALPGERARAVRVVARTADAIWRAAGDDSAGFAFVSKRATVAAVYGSTLLFFLARPDDPDAVASFLDRRLAAVAQVGRWRARLRGAAKPVDIPRTGDRTSAA